MTDLNIAQLLLLVIVLQQALAGLVWALAAQARVAPKVPALHWMVASFWTGAVVALTLLPESVSTWYRHGFPNLLSPGMYILMGLGLRILFRAPRRDAEYLAVVLAALGSAGIGAWLNAPPAWPILYASVLNAFCLLRCVQDVYRPAAREVGERAAVLMLAPIAIQGVVFVLRAAGALLAPERVAVPLGNATAINVSVLTLLLSFAVLIQLSLGLAVALRLVARLRMLATRDPLTGLLNRRGLAEQWPADSQPLSLLALDVDHFKLVNDAHGHAIGDAALRHLSERLQREARAGVDLPARIGGEEFLLVLPGTGQAGALLVAERLRGSIAAQAMRLGSLSLPLTVSLGVAELRAGEDPDALIARADAALYRAKAEGRNCVRPAV